jgi:SAM-dependent methyltransferase
VELMDGDALGSALLETLAGKATPMVIERDDGFIAVDGTDYFGGLPEHDQWAVAQAEGRVLDVGAGAGRGALAVQARGQEVTALDTSAGAIETCRRRGVRNVYLGTVRQAAADGLAGTFDSALLVGNNLGLLGSRENAASFLSHLGRLLKPGGVIVGTILDVYQTSNPVHLAYHQRNRDLGRMPGQLTMRVRYENMASAWFDWLAASPAETAELAAAAGWEVADSFPGISYAALLRRA